MESKTVQNDISVQDYANYLTELGKHISIFYGVPSSYLNKRDSISYSNTKVQHGLHKKADSNERQEQA